MGRQGCVAGGHQDPNSFSLGAAMRTHFGVAQPNNYGFSKMTPLHQYGRADSTSTLEATAAALGSFTFSSSLLS